MNHRVDPNEAEARAKRALDGMSHNRDAMARDVIALAAEVRNWRAAFDRMKAERKEDGFSKAFADIFGSASR